MDVAETIEDSGDFIILTKEEPFTNIGTCSSFLESAVTPKVTFDDESCKEAMTTIKEVLEENSNMKDVLLKNNEKMKNQCEEIRRWQDEMSKEYSIHKEVVEKYKIYIKILEVEKDETEKKCKDLYDKVEELNQKNAGNEKELKELLEKLAETKEASRQVEQRLQQALNELQQYKSDSEKQKQENTQLAGLIADLQLQCQDSQGSITKFSDQIQELEAKNQDLNTDLKKKDAICSELENQTLELKAELQKVRLGLQHQIEENKSLEVVKESLLEDLNDIKEEKSYVFVPPKSSTLKSASCSPSAMKKHATRCDISFPSFNGTTSLASPLVETPQCVPYHLHSSLKEQQEIIEGDVRKMRRYSETLLPVFKERLERVKRQDKIFIDQLQTEVDSLRNENQMLLDAKCKESQNLADMKQKYMELKNNFHKLEEKYKKIISDESEVIQLKLNIDQLTAKLLHLEDVLEDEKRQNNSLKENISSLTENANEASFYKMQAEIFRTDFCVEKELRLKAEEELKELKADYFQLQRQTRYTDLPQYPSFRTT